jgi:hypothetical protein
VSELPKRKLAFFLEASERFFFWFSQFTSPWLAELDGNMEGDSLHESHPLAFFLKANE